MTERVADDFAAIRRPLAELRREGNAPDKAAPEPGAEYLPGQAQAGRIDERYRARAEGDPPPWVPTIFWARGLARLDPAHPWAGFSARVRPDPFPPDTEGWPCIA